MTMYLLYCGLLVLWAPLLWPAIRLKGGARVWLLVVVVAGFAAALNEVRVYLWSSGAIRLDILVISLALGGLYGSAAVLLFFSHWRKAATLLVVVLVLTGGGMINIWVQLGRESERLSAKFHDSNVLLFKARFRSPEVYEKYFGPFAGASGNHPTGHWHVTETSRITRLIINARGLVWLFYRCQEDAECIFGVGDGGLREDIDRPEEWVASMKPQAGLPFEIGIARTGPGAVSVRIQDRRHLFERAPPPVDSSPRPQLVRFFGSFANMECSGAHAKIRQVWLWGDDARRYAVGIFSTLAAGRENRFVSPVVMGEGVREDGGWRFVWRRDGRPGTAVIVLNDGDAVFTLDQEGRDLEDADRVLLQRGGIFRDERIVLAPLTSGADWRHWFDTVLVGHFVSGHVPAC